MGSAACEAPNSILDDESSHVLGSHALALLLLQALLRQALQPAVPHLGDPGGFDVLWQSEGRLQEAPFALQILALLRPVWRHWDAVWARLEPREKVGIRRVGVVLIHLPAQPISTSGGSSHATIAASFEEFCDILLRR